MRMERRRPVALGVMTREPRRCYRFWVTVSTSAGWPAFTCAIARFRAAATPLGDSNGPSAYQPIDFAIAAKSGGAGFCGNGEIDGLVRRGPVRVAQGGRRGPEAGDRAGEGGPAGARRYHHPEAITPAWLARHHAEGHGSSSLHSQRC